MRGNRGPRGIVTKGEIEGAEYTGDPHGTVESWAGSAGAVAPSIGAYPTATIPIDENDDGIDKVQSEKSVHAGRRVAADTTKARLRGALKLILNTLAWLQDLARGTRTAKALTVDGTGGVDVVPTAGRITASENIVATGSMSSGTRTAKSVWIPGLSFVPRSGGMTYTIKGAIICTGSSGYVCCSLSPYLRIGSPTARIKSIVGYWNANSARTMELFQAPQVGTWPTNSDTSLLSANSTLVSGTVWSATLSGLTADADSTHTLWLDIQLNASDGFYGVLVTFDDAVL